MPNYECVLIARQDISSTQVEGLVEQFSGIIQENGGTVTKTEMWGLRNLAYRIKKNRKGHYAMLNIDAPSAAVLEMERTMRISEDVLRYLTLRVDQLEEGPSIVMTAKQSREERGRGGRGGRGERGDRGDRGFRGERGEHRARSGGEEAAKPEAKDETPKAEDKAKAEEKPSEETSA